MVELTAIDTPRTKTSFKYLINLVICVNALYLLAMFDLHTIDLV